MSGDDGDDDGVDVEPVGAAAQRAPDEHSDFRCKHLHVCSTCHAQSSRHYRRTC
jgi:hypothetical protein